MGRAQLQSAAAQDALEASQWQELKRIAEGLQETAQAILSATKVPNEFQDKTDSFASDLLEQAEDLAGHAAGQNASKAEGNLREIRKLLGAQQLIPFLIRIYEPVR